jgi:phosphoglycolate phosphatase-like HAD superfamily hydrolase
MKIGAITKMSYFELDKYFPVGCYGDNLLTKKDVILNGYVNSINYYKTSFRNDNVFVIADTAADINATKDLGFNSIAVKTGFDDNEKLIKSEPDWIFNDFSNLKDFERIFSN